MNLVKRRTLGRLASLLAVIAGGQACSDAKQQPPRPPVAVDVSVAETRPLAVTVGAIGVVAGRPGHTAALAAPAGGRVSSIMVGIGQPVAAGTPLLRLDMAPFLGAAEAAGAALANARNNYDRIARLVQQGILARKDLDQATADLEQARANAGNARRQQDLATLRAPIGGVITRMSAVLGAMVDPSQVLVEIADPRALDLLFSVTPSQAPLVRTGARIAVRSGQETSGEPLGVAMVVDVGEIIDSVSRGVTVRAQAPTTRRPLRIGETIFGEIDAVVNPRAIVVPASAIVPDGDGFRVFVVDPSGMARARPVAVGARTRALVEVTNGLAAGERVVTTGAYGLEDSTRVAPRPTPDPARP